MNVKVGSVGESWMGWIGMMNMEERIWEVRFGRNVVVGEK